MDRGGGEWERADHTACVRTAGSEVKPFTEFSPLFEHELVFWFFFSPPLQDKFLRHGPRHAFSVSCW